MITVSYVVRGADNLSANRTWLRGACRYPPLDPRHQSAIDPFTRAVFHLALGEERVAPVERGCSRLRSLRFKKSKKVSRGPEPARAG